jgi:multicomponent Na+:H+ antiporter subunit B
MKGVAHALLVAVLGAVMLAGLLALPAPGAPDAPAQTHVSADYVAGGADTGGASNLVTAVLLNYRALDTFGEVAVIFSAWMAVAVVLAATVTDAPRRAHDPAPLPPSPVTGLIVRLLAPFIAAFAAFVMVSGAELPGGGFQGGVVLGAMLVLLSVALGHDPVDRMFRPGAWRGLRAIAPLTFTATAAVGLVASGWWFGVQAGDALRHALMLLLEVAIGLGGAAVLGGIFLALSAEPE